MKGTRPSRTSSLLAAAAMIATLTAPFATGVAHAAGGSSTGCPHEMSRVEGSCVDRWEASLVEVLPNGSEIPWSSYATPTGHHVRAVSRPNVAPQAHISFYDAKAACKNAGKRLCRANEWVRACKGPAQTKYPYGDEYAAGKCVDSNRTTPNKALYSGYKAFSYEGMNDPRLNQLPNTLEKTGTAAACTNENGLYDMVGNLHEWAADGRFHGGYYLDVKKNGQGCDYVTGAHAELYYDYSTGFRCCADVDTVADTEDPPAEMSTPTTQAFSSAHVDAPHKTSSVAIEADVQEIVARVVRLWVKDSAS
jgi:hypothetical protein